MGNVIGSVSSGFAQLVDKILGHPLDFLAGKKCDSVCGTTWDLICYIENFCVTHLFKLVMVATLVYFVLLFFYLLYNLGICQCICRSICRIVWACFSTCFSSIDFCCSYLCFKLRTVKRTGRRRRRRRDIEELVETSTSTSEEGYELRENSESHRLKNLEHGRSRSSRRRNYKDEHLRRSLKPISHRAHVRFAGDSIHLHRRKSFKNGDNNNPLHHRIRVTRSSRFAQKGSRHRSEIHRKRK